MTSAAHILIVVCWLAAIAVVTSKAADKPCPVPPRPPATCIPGQQTYFNGVSLYCEAKDTWRVVLP